MHGGPKKKLNELHALYRTQQDRQREPSVKTLRSPLSAEMVTSFCTIHIRNTIIHTPHSVCVSN